MKKIVVGLIIVFILSIIGAIVTISVTGTEKFYDKISIDEQKSFTLDDSINQINLDFSSSDVNIIYGDTNEVKVHIYGEIACLACNYQYELNGSKDTNQIEFNINRSNFIFGITFFTNIKTELYIPTHYEKNLAIDISSGDIKITNHKYDYLNLSTSSGDITLKNLDLNKITVDTSSGDVEIDDLFVETRADISTSSGDITLDLIEADLYLETSSGDIEASRINGDFEATTSSGSVELQEEGNNFNININTSSGDVDVNVNNDASFHFITETSSGKIKVNFDYTVSGSANIDEDYIEGTVGNGENEIMIETSSGDINLK